jgi:hypothetical protein
MGSGLVTSAVQNARSASRRNRGETFENAFRNATDGRGEEIQTSRLQNRKNMDGMQCSISPRGLQQNRRLYSHMTKIFFSAIAALSLCSSVHGQASLSFSGGNGAPLTLTLAQPINYVINANHGPYQPTFFFAGPNALFPLPVVLSGNIFFTVNGGAPQAVALASFGSTGMTLAQNTAGSVFFGDSITLSAGTLVTTGSFFGSAPASGSYVTYVPGSGATGPWVSTFGVPVPEPGSVALAVTAGAAFCAAAWRRRTRQKRLQRV